MATLKKYEKGVSIICTAEEFEYLMMGLHALVKANLVNVDEHKDSELANENTEGELVKVNVGEMFIEQHVDISKLLDQLAEGYGHDPAAEG